MPRARILATLLTLVLLAGCTGGPREDADGDGVKDVIETEGKVITIESLAGTTQRTVTSDPSKVDTDGDGLTDGDELTARGSDPRSVDTDSDGLLDGDDVAAEGETARAWRSMGIVEINGTFLGELDACPPGGPQLRTTKESSDLPLPDGLADGEELRGWDIVVRGSSRHVTSNPCETDTDLDGLHDDAEKVLLTDPRLADTDGDGARDGVDADPLADLGIRVRDLAVETNRSAIRLTLAIATGSAGLTWPGNSSAILDVSDLSPSRDTLPLDVIITAQELSSGEPLDLFGDVRGIIVQFDLLEGTVSGLAPSDDPRVLRFSGADGSATLRWETART